ncbi:MAG TPA: NifU family protein [bacterium]|nr:NifU family protein [bacterium]HPR87280.1 NifU family protein [bacterium]
MAEVLFDQVNDVLDTIRPALMADGGNVELVEVKDGVVKLKLQGACHGCPMSQMTLKMGIERELKRQLPEISVVESV